MRALTDRGRLEAFMQALGRAVKEPARVYLTGGSTAVLFAWRTTTVDVDVEIEPESDEVLRAIPAIKERLDINVELASPSQFIPELAGWRERSRFIAREGPLDFFHYDFYAQALSKLERRHARDITDVREMLARGLVEPRRLLELFEAIEPQLYRYPAIDPRAFRAAVEEASGLS
jgi:hypothetical protein